jgi:hypothetical protein
MTRRVDVATTDHHRGTEVEPSGASLTTLETDGYVVVPTGLPSAMLSAVIEDVWLHTGAKPDDPNTWYQPEIIRPPGGMVEMYHYQSMWDIRQDPALYRIFSALHQTGDLWVSLDRIGFKPPARPDRPPYDTTGFIHWDADINRYPDIPFSLQGVLALEDTDADMGGFQCVPELYRDLQGFLDGLSGDGPIPSVPDIGEHPIVKVPLRAGEIAIWKNTLLHGNGRNVSTRPRLAQYVSMNRPPADGPRREESRSRRVSSHARAEAPGRPSFPGDPRRIEEERAQPAVLTPLGDRLLGLKPWD